MTRAIRRVLQVVAFVGTLMVGIVSLALIVSQTPWFRDWLRRSIVRESKQYLNGELSVGSLTGNLFFGVGLSDVAVDVSGQRVIAVKNLQVDYSVFRMFSSGVTIDQVKLERPSIHVERDATGWNLGKLVKKQAREADRKGPMRPISLPVIALTDGTVVVDDKIGSTTYHIPSRIDGLHLKGSFRYEPVHYSVTIDDLGFRGSAPDLTLQQLTGGFSVRDDNLYLERVQFRTGESAVTVAGVIQTYLQKPVLQLTTNGTARLPEIGRVFSPLAGYPMTPTFDVKAGGPLDRMALDVKVQSEAGNLVGKLTADLRVPDLAFKGEADIERVNAAPIFKAPAQRTDLTGHTKFDLTLASGPAGARALDRLRGTFAFTGPHAFAVGYQAENVRVTGKVAGPRIEFEGQAAAYGASATTTGFVVIPQPGKTVTFDLRGRASGVDLTRLPAITGAPKLVSKLSASEYQVRGAAGRVEGSAVLDTSQLEGATIGQGTVARFDVSKGTLSYAANGQASDVNLQRFGHVFKIVALDTPRYDTRLNSTFDVQASGKTLAETKLDATGTLTDSDVWGARFPQLAYEAHLNAGALDAKAKGRFEHLDPARIIDNDRLKGLLTGIADVHTTITDVTDTVTLDSIAVDGTVALEQSTFGELQIASAELDGKYGSRVGDVSNLALTGPDLKVQASGRIALDKAASSNLKYHVESTDLAALARLAGQESVEGSVVLDGAVTGNAASLQTTGKMTGSSLGWKDDTALDANSEYTVDLPDLDPAKVQVKSTTAASFVKVGSLEFSEVTATTTYRNTQLDFDANLKQQGREAVVRGDVIFHPDHQEIHLPSLMVRTQGVEWQAAPGSAAAVRYGNNRIEVDGLKLVSGDQSIDASGVFLLEGAQPGAALTVTARNVDISQVEKLALQNRGFTGRVDATAKIQGTTDAPRVSGSVKVTGGGFRNYKYDSLTATVEYSHDGIGLDATLQQSPAAAITAQGTIPMTLFRRSEAGHVAAKAGDRIDLHITSTPLDLGIVQGFTTAVTNVTGVLRVDLRLTGAGEDPHAEGIVDIQGGGFTVPSTGVSYSGLATSIAVSPERLTIPNLQVVDEEGEQMTITGSLGVHAREVGAVDVTVTSRNFELLDNELGDVGVETNLKVTGEMRRPKIEGEIKLQAARLEVDKILALFYDPYSVSAMPEVDSTQPAPEASPTAEDATKRALANAENAPVAPAQEGEGQAAPAPSSAFAPVEMRVHVRIPENLVLRGKSLRPGGRSRTALGDINITVGGDVDITKEPAAPVILLGSVDTVRGTYQFQGRRFDLVRGGTLRFTGEPDINPILDVSATREIPNVGVEARVHIKGTLRAPELELTSDPPLDESDILSLVVFNRPVNELGTGERSSLAATAGGIATGFLAAPLGESIGRALDLDLFEITTSTDSGDLGAGVTLGQQIGDRVFFRLRQQFGERTTSEFMIEYQLTDFLRMQGSAAPETSGSANRIGQRRIERAGIDLIFFFSY